MRRIRLGDRRRVRAAAEVSGGLSIWEGDDLVYLTKSEVESLFLIWRGAQGLPLCPGKGPTPAGSAGVKAGAKRSPEGCLDAVVSAGHLLEPHRSTWVYRDEIDAYVGSRWLPGVCTLFVMPGEASRDPREAACCV